MDSNPTSKTRESHTASEDPQSTRKLSIATQVREYYSFPDSQVSDKPQSKSLPSGPAGYFDEDDCSQTKAFQSLTDVPTRSKFSHSSAREEHRDRRATHHEADGQDSNSNACADSVNHSDRPKSLKHVKGKSRDISEAVKAALQASLDTSGPRVPSPASSIASNKRGLEWDSGADVGYHYEPRDNSHLSIIERLALARGSAAFQLGSSGTGSLSRSGDIPSYSLTQKEDVKAMSKSLASLDVAKSSTLSQARAISEPLAQSTPQEADRRSLILAAAAGEDNISPLPNDQTDFSKFPTMKSLSDTNLCFQEQVETAVGYTRRKSDTNISQENASIANLKPPVSSKLRSKTSDKPSSRNTRDQTVQTSETEPAVQQSTVGIQAGERSDSETKSRKDSSSSSDKSLKKVSLADAERFIAKIQRNASEHQKVIDKIKQKNIGAVKSTGAIMKNDYSVPQTSGGMTQERSSSSSDFNETPFSINVTNEHGTIGSANSFEYLPGDVYENANARNLKSPVEQPSNDAVAWGVVSNSLARDLEEGLQNFKTLLGNRREIDPQTKDQLLKQLVRKIIETDYQDDEESSTTGASVVYVPNQPDDSHDFSNRSSAQRQHRPNTFPGRSRSPKSDHGMHGDSSSLSQHFRAPSSSDHSSLPYSTSTSTSTTLETRDWRQALTQSEKRRQPDKRKPHSPSKRNDELAQITRKIHQLNKLKHLLERPDDNRCGDRPSSPNIYTVMTMLGVPESETDASAPVAGSSTELTASEENWSSHHHIGTTRNIQTQFPSRVRLTDHVSTSSTSESSWDTSLDHRARHGRINVYVQAGSREADSRRSAEKQATLDPLCCCQCERKLAKLRELSVMMSTSKSPSVSCCCECHTKPPKGRRPGMEEFLVKGSSSASLETPQTARRDVRLINTATSTTSLDGKVVQTTDSIRALPVIQPRWFPSDTNQDLKEKKEVCQCCGNEKGKQSLKILSESINHSNTPRVAENNPCNCQVCFKDLRFCSCKANNQLWDISAISGNNLQPRRREYVGTKSKATETDPPKALGYVLTFETPSTSEASLSEPPVRPPLKEVRVKAGHKGRPPAPPASVPKRSTVDIPMQTSTPSAESLSDPRSRTGSNSSTTKPATRSKESTASLRPTLQEYLRSNRPDYIETAEHRRQCLTEIAHLRELRLQSRRKLLALASGPGPSAEVLSSLPPPPLATKRVFSQRSMLRQTRRLHQRTEEVGKKRSELKRKEDYRTNRLMAEMFARKLQKNVLKGSVNLSNSKSVI